MNDLTKKYIEFQNTTKIKYQHMRIKMFNLIKSNTLRNNNLMCSFCSNTPFFQHFTYAACKECFSILYDFRFESDVSIIDKFFKIIKEEKINKSSVKELLSFKPENIHENEIQIIFNIKRILKKILENNIKNDRERIKKEVLIEQYQIFKTKYRLCLKKRNYDEIFVIKDMLIDIVNELKKINGG